MPSRFNLFQSNSLYNLVDSLAEIIRDHKKDPLERYEVVVQSEGMKVWLKQQLSKRLGVFASFEFIAPTDYLYRLSSQLSSKSEERSIFESKSMKWFIYREFEKNHREYPTVGDYLLDPKGNLRRQKLFSFSKEVAELFDSYILYRPQYLKAWGAGKRVKSGSSSLFGSQFATHEEWQMKLWQKILEEHECSQSSAENPVEVLERLNRIVGGSSDNRDVDERLKRWSERRKRVVMFNLSTVPPTFIEIFKLISKHIEVNLFINTPTRFYWGDLLTDRAISYGGRFRKGNLIEEEKSLLEQGNRLLRNLGEVGRDFIYQLYASNEINIHEDEGELFSERGEDCNLLGLVEGDILNWSDEDREERVDVDNFETLTVAKCHTALREVEVLYDYLSKKLDENRDLSLSDILIVTPDMERYAPLVDMQFNRNGSPLKVVIADRSLLSSKPIFQFIRELLLITESEFSASVVVSLFIEFSRYMERELSLQDEEIVKRWVRESGIRWGVDGKFWRDRGASSWGEDRFSWSYGLDRLLSGYAIGESGYSLPYSGIREGDSDLLGDFISFVESLFTLNSLSERVLDAKEWSRELIDWFYRLMGYVESGSEDYGDDTVNSLITVINSVTEEIDVLEGSEPLNIPFSIFRGAVIDAMDSDVGTQFLRGSITFSAMTPLRAVPFKVVAMVGMNHDTFPRVDRRLSFDLIKAKPQRGDRDIRKSDLYIFLETLISTTENFVITYNSKDRRSGDELPPSTVVEQLIEYCDRNYRIKGELPSKFIVKEFPLHPFSRAYLKGEIESYNGIWLGDGKFKVETPKEIENVFKHKFTPSDSVVTTKRLISYIENPFKDLFEQLMGCRFIDELDELEDSEPLSSNGLIDWIIRDAKIESSVNGSDTYSRVVETLYYSGDLPSGASWESKRVEIDSQVESIVERVESLGEIKGEARRESMSGEVTHNSTSYSYELETLPLYTIDSEAVAIDAGNLKSSKGFSIKRLMRIWITHLIRCCDTPQRTHFVTRDTTVTLEPIDSAKRILEDTISLYIESRSNFIPYFGKYTLSVAEKSGEVITSLIDGVENPNFGVEVDSYEKLFISRYRESLTDDIEKRALEIGERLFSRVLDSIKRES